MLLDAIKVFFEKVYQYNPALNPAAFMLDKDKSEHYAAGSVIIDRAIEGLQRAIQKLQSLLSTHISQAAAAEYIEHWYFKVSATAMDGTQL